jgi:hypothetical protein
VAKAHYIISSNKAVERWGFVRSTQGSVYGEIDGRPVHLFEGADDNGKPILGLAVGMPSIDAAESTADTWISEFSFLKRAMVSAEENVVVADIPYRVADLLGSEELASRIEQMVAASSPWGSVHRNARPALVNGVPAYLTETEAANLSHEGRLMADEYEQMSTRWVPALLAGLLGTVISALVWAAISVVTEREFWLVAIGAGFLISYLAIRGAGKTNLGLQVMVGAFTVVSVFLGQFLSVAWVMNQEFVGLTVGNVANVYQSVMAEDIGLLLFGLGGGLVGAWYGVRFASKPQLMPEIELAPAAPRA